MIEIELPYGDAFMTAEVREDNLVGVFAPSGVEVPAGKTQTAVVEDALDSPIASAGLAELARGRKTMTLVVSDHTRPVPSSLITPLILAEARKGNPDIDVSILVATGFHRATTPEELAAKLGERIVSEERVVVHDSSDSESLLRLADLPSGGELLLNKLAVEADLLVAEGFIEPHFFAGFSGGRKSVLPGVAGRETVLANHCAEFIDSESARAGILDGNPIHRDMVFAAREAGLEFIVNVVLNEGKKVAAAFAGDFERAHEAGCAWLAERARVDVPLSDVVVTSNGGHPLDQNVYQAVKGITSAAAAARDGGVVVIVAACGDGHGGEAFYEALANMESPSALLDELRKRPRSGTLPDQWEYQMLAAVLERREVVLVTDRCPREMITAMGMRHASTLSEALETAFELKGADADVAVVPDGVSVIVNPLVNV